MWVIERLLRLTGIEQICTGCPAHNLKTIPTEMFCLLLLLSQFCFILANNISVILILVFRILQKLAERKLKYLVELVP